MWFCDFVLRTPPRGGGWGPILKFLRPKWPILKFLRSKHRKRTLRCQRHLKWRLWRRRRRKPSQIINQTSRTVGFKRFYPGKFSSPSAEILKFSPPSAATFTNSNGIPRFKWLQNSKSYWKKDFGQWECFGFRMWCIQCHNAINALNLYRDGRPLGRWRYLTWLWLKKQNVPKNNQGV